MTTTDQYSCYAAQENFKLLINKLQPTVLTSFISWLDQRVAELKIFGVLLSESELKQAEAFIRQRKEYKTNESYPESVFSHEIPQSQQPIRKAHFLYSSFYSSHFEEKDDQTAPQKLNQDSNERNTQPPQSSITDARVQELPISDHHQTSFQMTKLQCSSNKNIRNANGRFLDTFNITDSSRKMNQNYDGLHRQEMIVECIDLESADEEKESRSFKQADQNPECGLLMEVTEGETIQQSRPNGSVSVIKLELPDDDEEQQNWLNIPRASDNLPRILNNLPGASDNLPSMPGNLPTILNPNKSLAESTQLNMFDNQMCKNVLAEESSSSYSDNANKNNLLRCKIEEMINLNASVVDKNDKQDICFTQPKNVEKQQIPGPDLKMCHMCLSLFDTEEEIQNHFKTLHPGSSILSTCIYCGKGFSDEENTQAHILTNHLPGEAATCVICGKTFTQLQYFKGHLNTHRGVHAFQCDLCNRTFTYKTHLTCHKRLCGGLNGNYKCKICGRQFGMQTHLSEHMRGMHAKKPRYTCTFCSMKFDWRGSCIRHKKKCPRNPDNYNVSPLDENRT